MSAVWNGLVAAYNTWSDWLEESGRPAISFCDFIETGFAFVDRGWDYGDVCRYDVKTDQHIVIKQNGSITWFGLNGTSALVWLKQPADDLDPHLDAVPKTVFEDGVDPFDIGLVTRDIARGSL